MIKVTPTRISDENLSDPSVSTEMVEQAIDFFSGLRTASLSNKFNLSLTNVVNAEDSTDEYESVEFLVTSRFKKAGVTWIGGEGFAVNLDALIDNFKDAYNRLTGIF